MTDLEKLETSQPPRRTSGLRPYWAIVVDSFHSALASRVLWAAMIAIWLLLASLAPIGLREDYTTQFRWFDIYNGTRMKAMLAQGIVDPASQTQPIGRLAAAMPDEMHRKLQRVGEGDEVRIRLTLLTEALNELIASDAERDDKPDSASQPTPASEPASEAEPDAQTESAPQAEPAPQDKPAPEDWYDAEAWKSTLRLRELRELDDAEPGSLSPSLLERRARLRIEAALPGVFEARSARSALLTYAGLEFPTDFQVDRNQFETIFNQFVIPVLVNWLLGLVLVFLGVLVTASIVPDMLQTGSLHLLLSKPVSRWALLVSKFVGGCAFVLLCVTQLVLGLYLIAALRLGVWNARILWCIPVALLIFAVFYSVSVLAGLKWRSAIISIAAAGALAAICVVVGIIGGVVDARVVEPDRIASITVAGDDLFAVTGGSGVVRLNETTSSWDSIIDSEVMSHDRILAPVALDDNHLLTARIRNGKFTPFGSGSLDLIALSRSDDWSPQPTLRLPTATERLIRLSDTTIGAINSADVLITQSEKITDLLDEPASDTPEASNTSSSNTSSSSLDEDAEEEDAEDNTDSQPGKPSTKNRQPAARSVGSWLRALVTMQGGGNEDFQSILPAEVSMAPPVRIAFIPDSGAIAILSGSNLIRLDPSADGSLPWQLTANTTLPYQDDPGPPVIAASSQWLLIAQGELPLKIFDIKTLQQSGQWTAEERAPMVDGTPLAILPISDSHFVYRTATGNVDVIEVVNTPTTTSQTNPDDADSEPVASVEPVASIKHVRQLNVDEVEAVTWLPAGQATETPQDASTNKTSGTLVVAHDVDRVTRIELDREGRELSSSTVSPQRSVWRAIDYYLIGGLEWFTPQVLQLGDTTAAMVSGNRSMVIDTGGNDLEVIRYRLFRPLASCLLFILVVMTVACIYFSRTDF
ncbi:ABC transporter permease [Neorhodopirellula lusitana]|uniref:ABC transporter permease n=1 Tax=Neorhodopirellula lusitana TaxID=445327 RepID=UPI00384D7F42